MSGPVLVRPRAPAPHLSQLLPKPRRPPPHPQPIDVSPDELVPRAPPVVRGSRRRSSPANAHRFVRRPPAKFLPTFPIAGNRPLPASAGQLPLIARDLCSTRVDREQDRPRTGRDMAQGHLLLALIVV